MDWEICILCQVWFQLYFCFICCVDFLFNKSGMIYYYAVWCVCLFVCFCVLVRDCLLHFSLSLLPRQGSIICFASGIFIFILFILDIMLVPQTRPFQETRAIFLAHAHAHAIFVIACVNWIEIRICRARDQIFLKKSWQTV